MKEKTTSKKRKFVDFVRGQEFDDMLYKEFFAKTQYLNTSLSNVPIGPQATIKAALYYFYKREVEGRSHKSEIEEYKNEIIRLKREMAEIQDKKVNQHQEKSKEHQTTISNQVLLS